MMCLRKTCAVLIAVVLLALSSWAGACDVSCSLAQFHSGCGSSAASDAEVARAAAMPADMDMGPMQESSELNSGLSATLANDGMSHHPALTRQCEQSPCNRDSVSAPQTPRLERISSLQLATVIANTIQLDNLSPSKIFLSSHQRPPGFTALDPLSVPLRV